MAGRSGRVEGATARGGSRDQSPDRTTAAGFRVQMEGQEDQAGGGWGGLFDDDLSREDEKAEETQKLHQKNRNHEREKIHLF